MSVTGLDSFTRNTRRSAKRVDNVSGPAVEDALDRVTRKARQIAPRDTGRLASRIRTTVEERRPGVVVAESGPAGVPYARVVEYEVRGGKPYMRPAFDSERRRMEKDYGDKVGRTVERSF